MLQGDPSEAVVKAAVEGCKRSVKLEPGHCDKVADYSGARSAPAPDGGPAAAGPSSKGPGTTG
jgi:hypothetical protein